VQKLQRRRLLTIVGSGGSDTTMAFPLADKLIEAPDNGVWLVGSPKAMPMLADRASRFDSPFADV